MLQIAQFIIDLFFVYFASYTYFTSTYFPTMPTMGNCAGEEFAAFAGMGILSSYLLLFISFYLATYKKDTKGGRGRKRPRKMSETATRATIDMARLEVPDVHQVGEQLHITGTENDRPDASSNGGVTPRVTRSKKA